MDLLQQYFIQISALSTFDGSIEDYHGIYGWRRIRVRFRRGSLPRKTIHQRSTQPREHEQFERYKATWRTGKTVLARCFVPDSPIGMPSLRRRWSMTLSCCVSAVSCLLAAVLLEMGMDPTLLFACKLHLLCKTSLCVLYCVKQLLLIVIRLIFHF